MVLGETILRLKFRKKNRPNGKQKFENKKSKGKCLKNTTDLCYTNGVQIMCYSIIYTVKFNFFNIRIGHVCSDRETIFSTENGENLNGINERLK